MKKLIMILMTAATMTAMSCGDGRTAKDRDTDNTDNTELAEPDTTMTEADTTTRQDDSNMEKADDSNVEIKRDTIR